MNLNEYIVIPFVEIEIRLGTLNNNCFDSSVDKLYFRTINSALEKEKWVKVEKIFTVEHYNNTINTSEKKENTRFIEYCNKVDDDFVKTGNSTVSIKENIISNTIQLKNSPFDVRFSINQEFSINSYKDSFCKNLGDITTITTRNKARHSYISENFKYDLTYVIQTSNNINKEKYEIEIELLQNDETISWDNEYISTFMECKLYDLINIIEPTERDSIKIDFLNKDSK